MAALSPGPRAIRVGLAAGSAGADVPPLVVEATDVDGRVLVDGTATDVALLRLDAERALLVRGGHGNPGGAGTANPGHAGGRLSVLLLPLAGAPAASTARGIAGGPARREVVVDGWRFEVEIEPAARAALRERATRARDAARRSGPTEVRAIIPGVVVTVSVISGDAVTAGQQLLVVEAMKMQNELRAPRDGTVERVAVGAGATIDVGDLLLVLG
jgi:biotin carboxyl carrier protein